MVLPPKYIKAAEVHNQTSRSLFVTVKYGSDAQAAEGKDFVITQKEVAPNAIVSFEETTFDMGSWKAVAPVHTIQLSSTATTTADAPPLVSHETNPDKLIAKQRFHIVDKTNGDMAIELGEAQ